MSARDAKRKNVLPVVPATPGKSHINATRTADTVTLELPVYKKCIHNKEIFVPLPKTRVLSARLPISLVTTIHDLAKARGTNVTELMRTWCQAGVDERETATKRHAAMVYEIVKSRALTLQVLRAEMDESQVDKMLTQAEETATEYVRERLKFDHLK